MTSTDRAAAEDSHRRRGPRPGRANHGDDGTLNPTQEAILEAARSSFLAQGFAKTTIRGVAREAGVDPALVSYYFGSKGALFGASMNLRIRASEEIAHLLTGDLRTAGPRLVRLSMTAWDDSAGGATFRALLRWIATDDGAPEAIQDYGTQQLAVPIAAALGQQTGMTAEVARERATLAGSQLVGLAMLRYVFRLEPVASSSVDRLVETVGPTIQHYLTGPLTSHR
ncbi:TetR/AcrR family transcriptional regulator [Actinomyces haliotis]|uniref:TetR/AcrR family transcriptional regulator n=1 Tax=Actinomyces haliotis TaxID=1280843 RepID=UPI00189087F6|nr:TetR family transcriptional regulator [Actinomyces haliotis]